MQLSEREPGAARSHFKRAAALLGLLLTLMIGLVAAWAAEAGDLDQAVNGGVGRPVKDPVDWVNGNANGQKAHYKEGDSIPYRLKLTDLTPDSNNTVTIEWDIKHSGKHAIDYITHYQRIAETVNPLQGIGGVPALTTTFAIPVPSASGSPPPGQPTASFNALPAGQRLMTLFGGTINSMTYVNPQGDLNAASSETGIVINFTPTGTKAVLAWGGHIADEDDWGVGKSATGISGSPYHTRFIDLNGSGGNQDRSLSTSALSTTPVAVECSAEPATICAGSTATLTASVDFGTQPYTFSWTGGPIQSGQGTDTITVAPTQTTAYTVIVTDKNMTTASSTCTVVVNPNPTVTIDPATAEICAGFTQTFTANPSGGSGNYSYKWTTQGGTIPGGTSTNQSITVGVAGSYSVEVTDTDTGCKGTSSATLTVNPNPSVSINPPSAEICADGSQTFAAVPSGGTPGYSYKWTTLDGTIPAGTDMNISITVDDAGTYSVVVTDSKGCVSPAAQATLVVNPLPSVSVAPESKEVCDGASETFTATGSGGTGPYTYKWTTLDGTIPAGTDTNPSIIVDDAGTYTVVATDSKGCKSAPDSGVLTVNPKPTVTIDNPAPEVCAGGSVKIKATGASGTPPLTYAWTGPGGPYTGAEITISTAGTYEVTATDAKGCTGKAQATLTVNQKPTVSIDPASGMICADGSTKTFTAAGVGGTGAYTYKWTTLDGTIPAGTDTNAAITVDDAGTYTVVATDSKGCASAPADATLVVNPLANCSITGRSFLVEGAAAETYTGPVGVSSWAWSVSGNGVIEGDADKQTVKVKDAGTNGATATLALTVVDANGCSKSCTKTIRVLAESDGSIQGLKFYDSNANGKWDGEDTEPTIQGWQFRVVLIDDTQPGVEPGPCKDDVNYIPVEGFDPWVGFTDEDGVFSIDVQHEGTFMVEEVFPGAPYPEGSPGWISTTPDCFIIKVPPDELNPNPQLLFGNILLRHGTGGKTLGFWSNKNGEAILQAGDPDWRVLLNSLNLVDGSGNPYDLLLPPFSFSDVYGGSKKVNGPFRPWLLNANAVNMAYMLSVQMAVTRLNVEQGAELLAAGLVGEALTYDTKVLLPENVAGYLYAYDPVIWSELANGGLVVTVGKLLSQSNASLAAYPNTVLASPERTYQDALKTACDLINNNKLPYVSDPVIIVVYP